MAPKAAAAGSKPAISNDVFLAACIKHAKERVNVDFEPLAKELGMSKGGAANKYRGILKTLEEEGAVWAQTANNEVATTAKARSNPKRKATTPLATEDSADDETTPLVKKTKTTAKTKTKKGIAKPVAAKKGKKAVATKVEAKSAAKVVESDSELENGNVTKAAAKKGKGKKGAAVKAEPKLTVKYESESGGKLDIGNEKDASETDSPLTPTTANFESGVSSPEPSIED